jgi:predicted alternative tryptophan synthase beta-subunit
MPNNLYNIIPDWLKPIEPPLHLTTHERSKPSDLQAIGNARLKSSTKTGILDYTILRMNNFFTQYRNLWEQPHALA